MSKKKQAVSGMVVVALMLFAPVLSIAGSLEPSAAPAPTMKTLDEVYSTKSWSKKFTCDSTTNCPRFEVLADFNDEAVLDKETGLVWERSPYAVKADWTSAMYWRCKSRTIGDRKGWRLPTIEELSSLLDMTRFQPCLPAGHPFTVPLNAAHWSATTATDYTSGAWRVLFAIGDVYPAAKTFSENYVWCVRGGQGSDGAAGPGLWPEIYNGNLFH